MPNTFEVQLDGESVDDSFYDQLLSLEVKRTPICPEPFNSGCKSMWTRESLRL